MQKGDVVIDMRVLKAMERRGLVILDCSTGKIVNHWSGLPIKAKYVHDYGSNAEGGRPFIYNGIKYELKYFDGCFNPFVVKTGAKELPSFG